MIFQSFNLLQQKSVIDNVSFPLILKGVKKKDARERALSTSPKILLLDEATSALDPKTTTQILELLKEINKDMGITMVVITHSMDVVKAICNKVAIIDEGNLVEDGYVNDIFANPSSKAAKNLISNVISLDQAKEVRSVPFLILLILLIPLTRAIVGKSYGPTAVIVPLTICAAPYIGRMVESSLKEVDKGVIEAARSMGASNLQIILKVLIPEAKPSLIVGATICTGTILGYSAMAGTVGGGGLGDIAGRYGYYRWQTGIMVITVALIVVLFQIFQNAGMKIAKVTDKLALWYLTVTMLLRRGFQQQRMLLLMKLLIQMQLRHTLTLSL